MSFIYISFKIKLREPPLVLADLKGSPGYIPPTYCEGIEALGSRAGPPVAPPRGDWIPLDLDYGTRHKLVNFGRDGWPRDLPSGRYKDARTRKGVPEV